MTKRLLALLLSYSLIGWGQAQEATKIGEVVKPPPGPAVAAVITSRSQQFRISGGTSEDRSIAALLAEEAKMEFQRLIEEKDTWVVPVRIVLHGKKGDLAPAHNLAIALHVTDASYEIRLDIHLANGLNPLPFQTLITSSLIYEKALAKRGKQHSDAPLSLPHWLVTGLHEATAWRLNQIDRQLYKALFQMGGGYQMDELAAVTQVSIEEMDSISRVAFRVSSGALVMALLQQPKGIDGFKSFLDEVASYEGEIGPLLRQHFPDLNLSETSLSKWWALQMANIGGLQNLAESLSLAETEESLVKALTVQILTREGLTEMKDVTAWPELLKFPKGQREAILAPVIEALARLSYRCFPSYRPILKDYVAFVDGVKKDESKMSPANLNELSDRRKTMMSKINRAKDYLNWFELTRAVEMSGDFDSYLKLHDKLKLKKRDRTDSISKYLDQVDALYYRGQYENLPTQSPDLSFSSLPE